MKFQTYATYIRGLPDLVGPIHGLLTMDDEALRFETFERKFWRWKKKQVELVIPRAELGRITDLDREAQPRQRTWIARILLWLNIEPNGIYVDWGDRTLVFDCERPIDPLLHQDARHER